MKDELKRVMSLICAVLFIVATALGIPVSENLLNVGRGKLGSLDISDDCEAEIKDIPAYGGDISEPCKGELKKLHRRIHHIEGLRNKEGNNARDTN